MPTNSTDVTYAAAGAPTSVTADTIFDRLVSVTDYGATGDGTTDDAASIQAALSANNHVYVPLGSYKIATPILVRSGQKIIAQPGAVIRTTSPGQTAIIGYDAHDVEIVDLTVRGAGVNVKTLNDERGFWFIRSDNVRLIRVSVLDFGAVGISLDGCREYLLDAPTIIGTAAPQFVGELPPGTSDAGVIAAEDGAQTGIRLFSGRARSQKFYPGTTIPYDISYCGPTDGGRIVAPRISYVAMGVLATVERAWRPGDVVPAGCADYAPFNANGAPFGPNAPTQCNVAPQMPERPTTIIGPVISNIPGQHAFYIEVGQLSIVSPSIRDTYLSGVKIQGGDAQVIVDGVTVTGAVMSNIRSSMFEIQVPVYKGVQYSGWIQNIDVAGVGQNVGRGLSINRRCRNIRASIVATDVNDTGAVIERSRISDVVLDLQFTNVKGAGVQITAYNSERIVISARLANVRMVAAKDGDTSAAIVSAIWQGNVGATPDENTFDMEAVTTGHQVSFVGTTVSGGGNMVNALSMLNSSTGVQSRLRFDGETRLTGATGHAIVSQGVLDLPPDARLAGVLGVVSPASSGTIIGLPRSFTPAVVAGTGMLTSYILGPCYFQTDGRLTHFQADFTITDKGTGSGNLQFALPFPATGDTAFIAQDRTLGLPAQALTFAGATQGYVLSQAGGSAIENGKRYVITGRYAANLFDRA